MLLLLVLRMYHVYLMPSRIVESDDDLLAGRMITEEVGEGVLFDGDRRACRRIDSLMELLFEPGGLEDRLRLSSESAMY